VLIPRPKSLIPPYRRHSSGQARVTINGRDHLLGPHGTKTSKQQYDRLIAEFLSSGRSPTFGLDADRFTIAVLILDYLNYAKSYYGTEKTSEWHRIKLAVRPLKALYASLPSDEFGPQEHDSGLCGAGS
jgi:hypothetical protein